MAGEPGEGSAETVIARNYGGQELGAGPVPVKLQQSDRIGRPYKEDQLAETRINVRNNGPLRLEGEFTLHDAEGNAFDLGGRTGISLCRCGHSEDKPFCDGSHKRVGFQSEVKARSLPPPAPKPPVA